MLKIVRQAWVFIALMALGAVGANQTQRVVDEVRRAADAESGLVFLPDPKTMDVASLGYGGLVADFLWMRAVLLFVDFLADENPSQAVWLRTTLKTVGVLDPRWRTPYFYGGGMLRLLSDIDGSDEIYGDGMASFPEDAHFPFSIAMNAYLYRKDLSTAVEYMERAGAMPNAPRWYRSAAAEFIHRQGQHRAAVQYLKGQIEMANSERERFVLESKLQSLIYDAVSSMVLSRQQRWEATHGRPLPSINLLEPLPPDPLEGNWFIAPDGVVRSDVHDPKVARRAKNDGRAMLIHP